MNNSDIIRSIRYTFDFNDAKMIAIFSLGGVSASRTEVIDWLKKDDDPDFKVITDKQLAAFLNGLIIQNRGKKDDKQPIAEEKLNNNIIFKKLKIALEFKDEDILAILESVGRTISKHELSAFFRNPTQAQYRPCQDQILRNFLLGLQLKTRPKDKA